MVNAKSMDVSKPGKAAPDPTARPVIVGHKPLLKDPMVSGDQAAADTQKSVEEKPLTPHAEKVIAPPVADEVPAEQKSPEPTSENPEASGAAADKADTAKSEEESDSPPESDDAAVVDALAEQAGNSKKKPGEQTDEEKKRQDAIDKLIEEKKYYIPTKAASRKRKARWNLVALLVLLFGAGGYLLVDAGIVGAGIKIPFNFIPEPSEPVSSVQQTAAPIQPTAPQPADTTPPLEEIKPVAVVGKSVTTGQSIKYTSSDIGLEFTYPKGWGEVKALKYIGDDKKWRLGTEVTIEFSANPQARATLRSRDYKNNGGGRGGAYWDAPIEYTFRQTESITSGLRVQNQPWDGRHTEKILIDEENLKASASCDQFMSAITINAYPYLRTNKTFDTGNFYLLIRDAPADGSGIDLTGCDNIDNLIKDTKDPFLLFARSIKAV